MICPLLQVTSESFREDGYFKTGDTVTIEDGYVKILGRMYPMRICLDHVAAQTLL